MRKAQLILLISLLLLLAFAGLGIIIYLSSDDAAQSPGQTSSVELPNQLTPPVSEQTNVSQETTTSSSASCGDEHVCDQDYALYCAADVEAQDWLQRAAAAGWRSGSRKYARTDCLQERAQDEACLAFQECHNSLNAELTEKCLKYTKPGEICAGISPAPGKAPLEDCLAEHLNDIDAACLDAYTRHEANRL